MEKQEIKMSCNEGILFYNYLNEIEFNPSVDFKKIVVDNTSFSDIGDTLFSYLDAFLMKFDYHEDFFRDACDPLVNSDSPYKHMFPAAYKHDQGEEYSEEYGLSFDMLKSFIFSGQNSLSDHDVKVFIYRVILCIEQGINQQLNSTANTSSIDIYNIPITIDNDFENLIEKEINQIANTIII